jgi:hypothetical protein
MMLLCINNFRNYKLPDSKRVAPGQSGSRLTHGAGSRTRRTGKISITVTERRRNPARQNIQIKDDSKKMRTKLTN